MNKVEIALDYETAAGLLGSRPSLTINYNTYLAWECDKSISITLHYTKIIIYHPDGSLTLNSGGWETVTTKERMNLYLKNYRVSSIRGEWVVSRYDDEPQIEYIFRDRMTITSDGRFSTPPFAASYIENVTGKSVKTCGDVAKVIRESDFDMLKKLWRKKVTRFFIAYYGSLDFLVMVACSSSGFTKEVISKRIQKGE